MSMPLVYANSNWREQYLGVVSACANLHATLLLNTVNASFSRSLQLYTL